MYRRTVELEDLENHIVVDNNAAQDAPDTNQGRRVYGPFFWWKPPAELRRLYRGSLLWYLCSAQVLMMLVRISIIAAIVIDFAGGKYGWASYRASAVLLIVEIPLGVYTCVEPFLPYGALTTAATVGVFLEILMVAIAIFASSYLPTTIWVNSSLLFVTLALLFGYAVCIIRYEFKMRAGINAKAFSVEIAQDFNECAVMDELQEDTVDSKSPCIQMEVITSGTAAS